MHIADGFELPDESETDVRDIKDVKKKATFLSALVSLLIKIGVIVGVILVLAFFVFDLYTASGDAMSPSVNAGDIVFSYRFDKDYSARDVIVLDIMGERQVRRVVATGGDTVDVTSEGLKVNGYFQQELYANGETFCFDSDGEYPLTLSDNEVFVLGDNRENSVDSRVYGPVRISDTVGSVISLIRRRDF